MTAGKLETNTAQTVINSLEGKIDYSKHQTSFSPFYSDIGLGFSGNSGISSLFLHYNRITLGLGTPFLKINKTLKRSENSLLSVRQFYGDSKAEFAFYEHNSWMAEFENVESISFEFPLSAVDTSENKSSVSEPRIKQDGDKAVFLFKGYLPTGECNKRDPDKHFPIILGARIIEGFVESGDGLDEKLVIKSSEKGWIRLAFSHINLDISEKRIEMLLQAAPPTILEAKALSHEWLKLALWNTRFKADDDKETATLSTAAVTLLFNSCSAPGMLSGRTSAFPSRGGYPVHYLWDSCFQNLGTEPMDPRLAEDALLLLTENIRHDGKIGHFLTSTWMRPHDSQPALIGWAGLALVEKRNDKELAKTILPALLKNNEWWFNQRMTKHGIIGCWNPLETGWDDTPRLDRCPILACDMNAYLLLQIQTTAKFAKLLGDNAMAAEIKVQAADFEKNMMNVLYDEKENIFRDVLMENKKKLPLLTPACLLPLLADLRLDDVVIRNMIEKHLLDKNLLYGDIPFPSVAYNERCYEADNWWRGPTWMPIAYLMTLILKKHGFEDEWRASAQKLYDILKTDGNLHELFNSKTGEGMGNPQQGWTAGIFLKLHEELK